MKSLAKVQFAGFHCDVFLGVYTDGRPALQLRDCVTDELVLTATVNVPDTELAKDEVVLKTYAEGQGIDQVLEQAGLIDPPHRRVRVGFTEALVARRRFPTEAPEGAQEKQ
ncbi:hypothetical protein [Deinococcus multiflagellatus]|uniref:Uncharacterized protein n=1 Tax=Deinococcus multiflagellatus TaxID=1656887 RepID=A0ABW1ZQR9_9DEIO|nr:hypothetical protein [Deinococcus multiflagellatus]MBZ9715800.1 hypothetical protein [Deinococcus multiflagellatus]